MSLLCLWNLCLIATYSKCWCKHRPNTKLCLTRNHYFPIWFCTQGFFLRQWSARRLQVKLGCQTKPVSCKVSSFISSSNHKRINTMNSCLATQVTSSYGRRHYCPHRSTNLHFWMMETRERNKSFSQGQTNGKRIELNIIYLFIYFVFNLKVSIPPVLILKHSLFIC